MRKTTIYARVPFNPNALSHHRMRLPINVWWMWLFILLAFPHVVQARALSDITVPVTDPANSGINTIPPPESRVFLPQVRQGTQPVATAECPTTSSAIFATVPTLGTLDRPGPQNPDLNLSIRSYEQTTEAPILIDYGGDTDTNAPQIGWIFGDRRAPVFTATYRVYDWDWPCGPDGCKGPLIPTPPVTLVALQSQPAEPIYIPWRGPQIYSGGYIALVLYAEETRLTLTYTRDNSPARGYVVHLEDICVDPNLLALYRQQDAQGRNWLPAIRPEDTVGRATLLPTKIAVRDEGRFMDPRSRKDWWVGY